MGGPALEVFKFSLYLFVPIISLLHFGDPDWYRNNVLPYRDRLFPTEKRLNQRVPTDPQGVREELARIKAKKAAKRAERGRDETPQSARLQKLV